MKPFLKFHISHIKMSRRLSVPSIFHLFSKNRSIWNTLYISFHFINQIQYFMEYVPDFCSVYSLCGFLVRTKSIAIIYLTKEYNVPISTTYISVHRPVPLSYRYRKLQRPIGPLLKFPWKVNPVICPLSDWQNRLVPVLRTRSMMMF